MAITAVNDQAGTTLTATVSANAAYTITYPWTITKTVTPDTLNLFQGDTGTASYAITLIKGAGTTAAEITGQVCVTNGGGVATEGLAITVDVAVNPGGGFTDLITGVPVSTASMPVISAGGSACYPYSIPLSASQIYPGATYKVTAHVTILNHSGHLGTPFGPNPSSEPNATMPTEPTPVHNSVTVTDTNGGSYGPFDSTQDITYTKTFTCTGDAGSHTNTATITYDDGTTGPFASATVTVNCYALNVTKTATTSFSRQYNWSIDKTVSTDNVNFGDTASLVIQAGDETHPVYYQTRVQTTGYTDKDFKVTGNITITNPAPIPATINGITDTISGLMGGILVICMNSFPYVLAANSSITCSYEASLPDMTDRTNTATVTLQNHVFAADGTVTDSGTTDFSVNAGVTFAGTQPNLIDTSVTVTDNRQSNPLGTVTADQGAVTFSYSSTVGPYPTPCSTDTITNTATLTTNDTGTTVSDSTTVNVTVPCQGCTHTIGYWKTHAGFTGNNPDRVTPLLPIWLGTADGAKSVNVTSASQAVGILNFNGDASNGINRLYAQLLGAKLNKANGASDAPVSGTIAAVDAFLATHNAADWAGLSRTLKNQVNAWQTTLDLYNNGQLGVPHCSESGEVIVPPIEEIGEETGLEPIQVNISNSRDVRVVIVGENGSVRLINQAAPKKRTCNRKPKQPCKGRTTKKTKAKTHCGKSNVAVNSNKVKVRVSTRGTKVSVSVTPKRPRSRKRP